MDQRLSHCANMRGGLPHPALSSVGGRDVNGVGEDSGGADGGRGARDAPGRARCPDRRASVVDARVAAAKTVGMVVCIGRVEAGHSRRGSRIEAGAHEGEELDARGAQGEARVALISRSCPPPAGSPSTWTTTTDSTSPTLPRLANRVGRGSARRERWGRPPAGPADRVSHLITPAISHPLRPGRPRARLPIRQ